MWIKAKNGNVVEVDDEALAKRAHLQEHEVYASDPREKGAKRWTPDSGEADASAKS